VGSKTGARMGHVAIAGPGGPLERLAGRKIGRRILVHVNNTNPILRPDSPERARIAAAGWEVAQDGMEVTA
jgi:pyrroloquinoline quinone biosynthesis protein B